MLCTKFQPNISSGSGGKVDFKGLSIFSNSGHICFLSSLNFIFPEALQPCHVACEI